MAMNTKIKPLKLKKHALNICLNLIKLQLDQGQLLMIIPKTKMCLFEMFQAVKAILKVTVQLNSARTSNNAVIFGDSIVNFSTKLK